MYSFAFYSLRVKEDAEDIAQETFLRLCNNWKKIDVDRAGAWLMQVAHNLVVDHVRKQQNNPQIHDNDIDIMSEVKSQDSEVFKQIVEQSIAKLKDPFRTTIILRDIQSLSYKEVSEILSVPVSQVKSDLFRGRKKLRELVKKHDFFTEDLFEPEVIL